MNRFLRDGGRMLAGLLALGVARGTVRYVAQDGQTPDPAKQYTNWTSAAATIQDALNVAAVNDTIWVGPGTYKAQNPTNFYGDNVVFVPRPLILRSSEGADVTVIDGEAINRCLVVHHRLQTTNPVVIEGFTFTNGWGIACGGGVYVAPNGHAAWPCEVRDCRFLGNTVNYGTITTSWETVTGAYGGGLGSLAANYWKPTLLVSNCLFRGNQSIGAGSTYDVAGVGGGFHIGLFSFADFFDCVIEDNTAVNGGGGSISWPSVRIERSIFRRNRTQGGSGWGVHRGGGLTVQISVKSRETWIRNSLFYANTASEGAGIFFATPDPVSLHNSTIVSNRATISGGGVHSGSSGNVGTKGVVVRNTILTGNLPDNLAGANLPYSVFTNCCTSPLTGLIGEGNIDADPAFVDFDGADYRLTAGSPCANAGITQSWMSDATDLAGLPRQDRVFKTVDIGCFEYPYAGSLISIR